MRFVTFDQVAEQFRGKSVAVVGSAPSCLENSVGFVDSHDIVLRINNHKCGPAQGFRTDVHYSFYGNSIRKTAEELKSEGVRLLMCKCPDAKPLESEWHERNHKEAGVDFRYIFSMRAATRFWFCDTFVPSVEHFMRSFNLLGRHIPTTGFAAILDILACEPKSVYLTGFDFMTSGLHNVNEPWRPGDPADPIGHRPRLEAEWLAENCERYPLAFDAKLAEIMNPLRAVTV